MALKVSDKPARKGWQVTTAIQDRYQIHDSIQLVRGSPVVWLHCMIFGLRMRSLFLWHWYWLKSIRKKYYIVVSISLWIHDRSVFLRIIFLLNSNRDELWYPFSLNHWLLYIFLITGRKHLDFVNQATCQNAAILFLVIVVCTWVAM